MLNRIQTYIGSTDRRLIMIVAGATICKFVLLALIVIRLGVPGLVNIVDDGTTYRDIAVNILGGNGYSMTHEAPYIKDAIRAPVVPYLMAASIASTGNVVAFSVLGIVLSVLQIVALWHIGTLIGLNRRFVTIAAVLYAFEPAGLMLSVLAISEPLFVTFFLLGLWAALRVSRTPSNVGGALAGVCLGLASLTRPIGLYAAAIILVWLFIMLIRKAPLAAAAAVVLCVLTVSPWFIRNERAFGVVAFSSGGVQNVFLHFGATVLAIRDNTSVSSTTDMQYRRAQELSGLTTQEVAYQDLRLNSILKREAVALIADSPAAAFKALAYTQVAFFTNDSYRFYYLNRLFGFTYNSSFNPTLALFQNPLTAIPHIIDQLKHEFFLSLIGRLIAVLVSAAGLMGICILVFSPGNRAAAILLGLQIAYFAAASATGGYGVTVRYRFPVAGILCLGTAVLLQTLTWYYATHAKNRGTEVQSR